MGRNQTIQQEINQFLEFWDLKTLISFLQDIIPLLELYEVEENNDWVKDAVGEEDVKTIRLIRTVYLISKIAEKHAGKLSSIKINFKDIWRRMEKEGSNGNETS